MQFLFNALQQPTTLITAIVVVIVTAIIFGPKWLHWWSDWKKWQASQKVPTAAEGGTLTSQTLAQNRKRRLWQIPKFWPMVFDLLFGFGALTLLFVLTPSDEPATVGRVAWCVMLGCLWIVSSLRRW